MKIRSVGAELFHADRRTDMTKLIVAFRNFANAPKTVRPTFYNIWLCVSANMAVSRRSCYRNIQRKAEFCLLHSVIVPINSVTAWSSTCINRECLVLGYQRYLLDLISSCRKNLESEIHTIF
jgi:hypothetical protein